MRGNVKMLGWAFIVWNALSLCGGLVALLFFALFGGMAAVSGGQDAHATLPLFGIIGLAVFFVAAALSIPGLLVGWGLITFQPWARIGGILLSALHLTAFPLGTAIGVFGLITLCDAQAAALFERS